MQAQSKTHRVSPDARIGHVHHGGVYFDLSGDHTGGHIPAGECIKDGRFAGLRQSNDSQFHTL